MIQDVFLVAGLPAMGPLRAGAFMVSFSILTDTPEIRQLEQLVLLMQMQSIDSGCFTNHNTATVIPSLIELNFKRIVQQSRMQPVSEDVALVYSTWQFMTQL